MNLVGLPTVEDIAKELTKRFAGNDKLGDQFYGAMYALVAHRDNLIDMLAAGIAIIQPEIGAAYNLVFKNAMLKPALQDAVIPMWLKLDNARKNTTEFNNAIPGLASGINHSTIDHLYIITVSNSQFHQIMNDRIFNPDDYKFFSVNPFDKGHLSKVPYFDGEEPAFYIYYNDVMKKGFVSVSEIGIAPIFPKKNSK
ncbi:MAG: hypothetical protein JWP69_1427 [Flaviaesturariibacter sp.]|nr:hypothetical protein [Flaviaesturariibacter sp.]